jgi:hypothetical protein
VSASPEELSRLSEWAMLQADLRDLRARLTDQGGKAEPPARLVQGNVTGPGTDANTWAVQLHGDSSVTLDSIPAYSSVPAIATGAKVELIGVGGLYRIVGVLGAPANPVATAAATNAAKVSGPTGTTAVASLTSCFAASSDVAVTWGTTVRDDGGLFSALTPSRLTAAVADWYEVGGRIHFSGNTTGATFRMATTIKVNGTNKARNQVQSTSPNFAPGFVVPVHDVLYLNAGDYVELFGFQDTTAAMSILTTVGEASNSFYLKRDTP